MNRYKFGKLLLLSLFMFYFMGKSVEVQAVEQIPLVVEDYAVTGEKVVPGNSFTLTIGIRNYDDVAVEDVLVDVQIPNGVAPVYGSVSQLYIDNIEANERKDISFEFVSFPSIDKEVLDFGVAVVTNYSSNYVTVRIPVGTDLPINIVSYSAPQNATIDQMLTFSTTFRVIGTENVRDVNAILKVDGVSIQNTAVGIVAPGTTKTQNLLTQFTNVGEHDVEFCLDYLDETGQEKEISVFETTVVVSEQKQNDMLVEELPNVGDQPTQTQEYSSDIILLGIGGVIVLILFLVIVNVVKKRR